MSGGAEPVDAELWLLNASNSIVAQSHHNPDGTGLGIFDAEDRPRSTLAGLLDWLAGRGWSVCDRRKVR